MKVMDDVAALWPSLASEWQGNPRLRQGGVAICGILFLYVVLVLSDAASEQVRVMQDLQVRYDRVAGLNEQQFWLDRAIEGEAQLAELQASFPAANSTGRAEAEVRGILSEAVKRAENPRLTLKINAAEQVGDSNMWKVTANISGLANGDQVRSLLKDVESGTSYMRISGLRLVRGKNAVRIRLEMDIAAYFQRSAG
jgi:hypothetical protein